MTSGPEQQPLDDRPLDQPRADRLDRSHPLAAAALTAHADALAAGGATYRDPISGYRVLTARTLADRGTCCGLGCRHCPYVPAGDPSAAPDRATRGSGAPRRTP